MKIHYVGCTTSKKTLNFFTVATGKWRQFIIPYIMFALFHNKDSSAEIVTDTLKHITNKQINFLNKHFKNRWCIRLVNSHDAVNTVITNAQAMRWVLRPMLYSKYVYIGDVDIMILEKNIAKGHVQHMDLIKKPYSNMVRSGPLKKMTGLHFVDKDAYFSKVTKSYQQSLLCSIKNTPGYDEKMLYKIVKEKFGLPKLGVKAYRPVHGIHMSQNRKLVGWNVSNGRLNKYKEVKNSNEFQDGIKVFDKTFIELLSKVYKANVQYNVRKEKRKIKK